MYKHNIHSHHIKNTHKHPHDTEIYAGKTASVYIKKENAYFYKVFLSTTCNKVSAPSLLLSHRFSSLLSKLALPTTKEIQFIFYLRGLFERFPPIYLPYSIALNGLFSLLSYLDLIHTTFKADPIYSLHKGTAPHLNSLCI
jgi:hypothetical protein